MMDPSDMNQIITAEYESAASWCAHRNIAGKLGDPLPANITPQTLDKINEDPEEFQSHVRLCAYAITMARLTESPEA